MLALALALATCLLAGPARADDAACVASSERGLSLRKDGKFHDALRELAACADTNCPEDVRAECTRRIEAVAAAMPTLVLGATDPKGNDLREVRVTLDGAPLAAVLDGRAIQVDPGPHTFRFEAEGRIPVAQDLILREGEKDRREVVVLATEAGAAPPVMPLPLPAPAKPNWWTLQRTLAVVAGGIGVVGVGVGATLGVFAANDQSMEKSNCSTSSCTNRPQAEEDYRTGNSNATASTVSFVAGGALLAAGVVLLLTAHDAAAPAQGRLYLVPGNPSGPGFTMGGEF